jgi:hypothetical protein
MTVACSDGVVHASMQTRKYASTQARKHAITHTCTHARLVKLSIMCVECVANSVRQRSTHMPTHDDANCIA